MLKYHRPATACVFALAAFCVASVADAQIVRLRRGAGIVVNAPYAPPISVNLGLGGVVPRGPLPRPYLLPRRRALAADPNAAALAAGAPAGPAVGAAPAYGGPLSEAPRYVPGGTNATVQANVASAPSGAGRPFPTEAELAALDDGTLLNALLDVSARLDDDLGKFNTGAGWQKYLRLPADALPPPSADGRVTLGFRSLTETLERLNTVAANAKYPMISGLSSFVGTHAALQEVVGRFGTRAGNASGNGAAQKPPGVVSEELPTPPPSLAAPANAKGDAIDERSILAR